MSIYNHCKKCKQSFDLKKKKCPKCETPVPTKDKKYRVIVRDNGHRISKLVNTLDGAEKIEKKIKVEIYEGTYYDRREASYTVNNIWEKYIESYKLRGKAWHKEETRYNKTLRGRFGNKPLKSVSPFEIEKFMIELKNTKTKYNRPYSPKSIKNIIDLLGVLYNYAKNIGLYSGENPCERVKRPKVNNIVINILPVKEIKKLLDTLNTYEDQVIANILRFLLFTGTRRGEAFKLKWSDINFKESRILLRDPKGGMDQYLNLNKKALEVLNDQYKLTKNGCELVFPDNNGNQRKYLYREWDEIKKRAGITQKYRVHDLRGQFASLLASSGKVDQYTLQKAMTHKDFKTTQRYAHLFPGIIKSAVEVIDETFNEITDEPDESEKKDKDVA